MSGAATPEAKWILTSSRSWTGKVHFVINPDASTIEAATSEDTVDDSFHFWTGVYDEQAGMQRIHMDGELVATNPMPRGVDYYTSEVWLIFGAVGCGS